jgi:hypothetical protein
LTPEALTYSLAIAQHQVNSFLFFQLELEGIRYLSFARVAADPLSKHRRA